jgi:hypothetical protein
MSHLNWQRIATHRNTTIALVAAAALGVGYALYQTAAFVLRTDFDPLQYVRTPNVPFEAVYQVAMDALLLLLPAGLLWYGRKFARTAVARKRIDSIASMANQAVAYAEDCDRRGDRELLYNSLDVPESLARNPSTGHQKLILASAWLADELARQGIKRVGVEDATRWVAAEYQKTVGDMRAAHSATTLADMAADLLGQLGRAGQITLPNNTLETVALIQTVADWAVGHTGESPLKRSLQRDAAMARIAPRALMTASANGRNGTKISPEVRLAVLGKQAFDFVAELKKQGKLRMSEQDTARAWMIQQVQQDDIPATAEQIQQAITSAMGKHDA